jgi:hypothetical protein
MVTAFRLKNFGDDDFGKVSAHCKVGAAIANLLLPPPYFVFFPASGAARSRLPVCVRPLNDELECTSATNLQRSYVGDGDGEPHLAGLGIPSIALTAGTLPSSEILFKKSLHEVKGLLKSQVGLKIHLLPMFQ